MSSTKWLFWLLVACPILQTIGSAAPEASDSAYQILQTAENKSRSSKGFHLRTHFTIDASDREDTMTIRSRGIFRKPVFKLESETPTGMEVTSYGRENTIAHIDPATDEIVTSEELGISSVNRQMLDPFQHLKYLMKPDYEGFSCTSGDTKKIDGSTHRIIRVRPGPNQIRDVMKEFQNQLERPLKPERTDAEYTIFIDEKTDLIRRIELKLDAELVPKKQKGDNVTIQVDGQFDLTKYDRELDFSLPADVKRKLQQWQ